MADFIHLHNHSHYSMLDAACTVDALVDAAARNGMPAVALTDHGVMFGALEFQRKARKKGIKPIFGNEMYMVTRGNRFDRGGENHPEGKRHGYNHIVLLAKNEVGYRNLIKLTTLAHTEGYYYKPRIDFELLERHHEGLVALTACAGGVVSAYLAAGDEENAKLVARRLRDLFGEDLYLEIQNHGTEREARIREAMPRIARDVGARLIATNDCHYIEPDHAVAHNVFLHIADTQQAEDITRLRYETDQVYFKSVGQMLELFRDTPEAIESTLEVADKCALEIELGEKHMPHFPLPPEHEALSLDAYLRLLSEEGLERRYGTATPELRDRLNFELSTIERMGYSGYFLIVQDFINAAKKKGIRVGPGRGSAAGSLVAYALAITDVDPIRYDLLFERFLNPDRVSMPDIDVDFQDERREEVINYVREKYGASSVSQIITFGKLSGRAVLKDVGRVLGVPLATVESITKHIPVRMGKVAPLRYALGVERDPEPDSDKAWKPIKELAWVRESPDPKIQDLVKYSLILEGLIRNVGMHAAGVVIAPSDTSDYVPLYKTPNTELMTMFNGGDLEDAGLLKMDFLGLITLTVIHQTLDLIRRTRGLDLDIDSIPLDDEATYAMFGEGHTIGVFQFESAPMREYLRKLKPQSIDDLAAMNALYRPGPMEFIDEFIDRKFGRKDITYLHPSMERILKSTYGIIVFQEQVMMLASEIAKFSLAQSDIMRRAMGKKKASEMAQQRTAFEEGAVKNGVPRKVASDIFDMIDKFANYGFNKSHSVAYSLLAYQTAYLKANYTAEFMAAMMTAEYANTEKVAVLIDECRKLGIPVRPPNVNEGEAVFSVRDGEILFGLAAIKNVGQGAVDCLVEERTANGPFTSLYELCSRVPQKALNRKTLESLVFAGAMDALGAHRAQLADALENAIAHGVQEQNRREIGQSSLFDALPVTHQHQPVLPDSPSWTTAHVLALEKSVLGFYVSGHPLEPWRLEAEVLASVRLGEVDPNLDGSAVKVCGLVSSLRTKIDKRGRTMAFAVFEDFTGKAEGLVFADAYERSAAALVPDAPVYVAARAQTSGDGIKLMVDEVLPLDTAVQRFAKAVIIRLSAQSTTPAQIEDASTLLRSRQGSGSCTCFFSVRDEDREWKLFARGSRFSPTKEILDALRDIFGSSNVRIALE